jgi:D-alanyl-D-alanine carboxypeptidase (penicillin-binding protein 5/6)
MTLSIFQKLLLLGIKIIASVFWLIDITTNLPCIKFSKKILRVGTAAISVFFVSFLVYSYSSQILAKIADGYFGDFFVFTPNLYHHREYPILVNSGSVPYVTSKSYLIADIKNSKILYEHNSNQKLPLASTTKLMTALVALDIYQINEILEVPEICSTINSTKVYLPVKSLFSVKDLIYSMLIGSAGDSACVLSLGKLPYENFISLMNRKASLSGLLNTRFSNPIGLDDDGGQNFSTVQDLLTLAKLVMHNPIISDAVKTRVYELKSQDGRFNVYINSTNRLLSEIPNTLGIKTGTTESAGEVFVYDFADREKDLVIIVMGSSDRFSDTKTLLNWALGSYSWK